MEKSNDKKRALDRVAYYLAQRDHSAKELEDKLQRKFETEAARWALEEAHSRSWIKPPEVLSEQVKTRLQSRRKGPRYIQNYLRKIGLPEAEIDADENFKNCTDLLNSKFPNWKSFSYKEKEKPARFLISRGFDYELVKEVLFRSSNEEY
jgi:SOS response regulatory protein OraA/RecX